MPHLDVANLGGLRTEACRLAGDGEEGRHPQRHPGRHSLGVQPEVDPGDDDEHAAGDVDGDEVVGELALEHQVHGEAAVLPRVGLHVAVAARVLLNVEPIIDAYNRNFPCMELSLCQKVLGEQTYVLVGSLDAQASSLWHNMAV